MLATSLIISHACPRAPTGNVGGSVPSSWARGDLQRRRARAALGRRLADACGANADTRGASSRRMCTSLVWPKSSRACSCFRPRRAGARRRTTNWTRTSSPLRARSSSASVCASSRSAPSRCLSRPGTVILLFSFVLSVLLCSLFFTPLSGRYPAGDRALRAISCLMCPSSYFCLPFHAAVALHTSVWVLGPDPTFPPRDCNSAGHQHASAAGAGAGNQHFKIARPAPPQPEGGGQDEHDGDAS